MLAVGSSDAGRTGGSSVFLQASKVGQDSVQAAASRAAVVVRP